MVGFLRSGHICGNYISEDLTMLASSYITTKLELTMNTGRERDLLATQKTGELLYIIVTCKQWPNIYLCTVQLTAKCCQTEVYP